MNKRAKLSAIILAFTVIFSACSKKPENKDVLNTEDVTTVSEQVSSAPTTTKKVATTFNFKLTNEHPRPGSSFLCVIVDNEIYYSAGGFKYEVEYLYYLERAEYYATILKGVGEDCFPQNNLESNILDAGDKLYKVEGYDDYLVHLDDESSGTYHGCVFKKADTDQTTDVTDIEE